MAFNGKSYTLQQVADVIGFTGNRGSIHSKFDNVFADVKEFTNEEKAISISFALQYNLQGMKLHGRSLKQSRKIYLSAIEDLQYLNHVVEEKQKQCVDKKVFDLCDIIKEDREEIKQLKSILAVVNKSEPVTDKKKESHYIIKNLRMLLETAIKNEYAASPNGHRYEDDLENFFVLLSLCGEHVYTIVKKFIGLPCFSTAVQHKRKLYKQVFGVDGKICDLYDGKPEHVQQILDTFLEPNEEEKFVLAIDACSLKPNIHIYPDGTVTGLTQTNHIDKELVSTYTKNQSAFGSFLNEHSNEIISASFVVLLIPVNPLKGAFPIMATLTTSGAATPEIEKKKKTQTIRYYNIKFRSHNHWIWL